MPRGRPRKEVIDEIRNRIATPISFSERSTQRQAEALEAFKNQSGEPDPDTEAVRMAEALLPKIARQPQPDITPLAKKPQESPLISFTQQAYDTFLAQGIDPERASTLTLAYAVIELGAVIQGLKPK